MSAGRLRQHTAMVAIGLVILLVFSGCTASQRLRKSTFKSQMKDKKPKESALYHDFEDVLIPSELKLDERSSFVYRTPNFAAGVLAFRGRVEMNSLVAFFDTNMAKDNWQLVSSFRSPRTIMLFHKGNRWCVISIAEKDFNTYAEIWVAPTVSKSEEGLYK